MRIKQTILFILSVLFLFSCHYTTINDLLHDGFSLSQEKNYDSAIEKYTEAIKKDSKLQLAYYNRGQCYFDIKNYTKALADFDTVMAQQAHSNSIVTDNKNISAANTLVTYNESLYQRAQLYFYMDSMNNSLKDFQFLIDNDYEEKINCILWQGVIWQNAGEKDRACNYYHKAKQFALKDADKGQADKMINTYCSTQRDSSVSTASTK